MIALAQGKKSDNPNKFFPGNRPSRLLFTEQCDPYHVGALLAYFEHKVAFQGFIWNINSFDQEGVQLGKRLANEVLSLFADIHAGKPLTPQDFPLGQAFLKAIQK
jgi:glucose-6-phosphate isomerase